MAIELAEMYVSVIPEAKGVSSSLTRQFSPAQAIASRAGRRSGEEFTSAFQSRTSRIGQGLASVLKTGVAAAAVGIGAAGIVGIKTAAQLETAQIGFTTMLGSAKKARGFLGDLGKFAAKTPFDLPGLQESASQLVAIGIKSKDVIPIMTTLGNITSGMGTGAEGVQRATRAIQQMNAAGKITAEDLNQLRDAGVPVYDLLTTATGKSTKQISEMRDAGELGRKELDALMTMLKSGKGLERFNGLMEKQSQSLAGLWSTAKDTFSVGMAGAIKPLIPLIKDGLAGSTAFLADVILPKLQSGLATVVKWGKQLDFTSFKAFVSSLMGSDAAGSVSSIGDSFAKLLPVVKEFVSQLPSFNDVLKVSAGVFSFLADHVDTLIKFMPVLIGLFVAYKVGQMGLKVLEQLRLPITIAQTIANFKLAQSQRAMITNQAALTTTTSANTAATATNTTTQRVGLLTRLRAAAAATGHKIALVAHTVATKAATGAQRVLNFVMSKNPIAIVIKAVAALVAGLVWFFTQTEIGQKIVRRAWSAIKVGVGAVVGWFKDTALPFLTKLWKVIGAGAKWLYEEKILPAWRGIKRAASAVVDWFRNTLAPGIAKVVDGVGAGFSWLWEEIVRPVFRKIGDLISGVWRDGIRPAFRALADFITETIPNAFRDGVRGIKGFWENLKSIAKKPIKFMVDTVYNKGIRGVFNTVMDFVGSDIRLPKLNIKGFAKGGFAPKGWAMVGEEGPELVNFAQPGRVYTAKQTSLALRHEENGAAANGGGGFSPIWGGFQDSIRSAARLFVSTGAGSAWNIPGAASMWDKLAGLRVRAGRGSPQATTGLGPLGSILAWATGAGNITFNTQGLAPGLSPVMKTATAAHEIGHVLGLPHTMGASIMQPTIGKYMTPTAMDKRRLESLYGPGSRAPGGGGFDLLGWIADKITAPIKSLVSGLVDKIPGAGRFLELAGAVGKYVVKSVKDWAIDKVMNFGGEDPRDKGTSTGTNKFGAGFMGTLHDDGGKVMPGTTLIDNQRRKPEALLNPAQWSTAHRAMDAVERQAAAHPLPDIYVQNPFTGEWMLAKVDERVKAGQKAWTRDQLARRNGGGG